MRFFKYLFFTINLILFSCVDEPGRIVVHTGLVTEINAQGALFTGSVQGSGTSTIVEHGFVWSTHESPTLENNRYRITESVNGEFEKLIQSELLPKVEYFVRAYAMEGNVTWFGETVKFLSQGSLGPIVTSFNPVSGSSNTIITIDGANFSSKSSDNAVSIGPFNCSIMSSTPTQIKAQLPPGITTSGLFKVAVKVGNTTGQSADNFTLIGPVITNVSPISAIQGTVVTITGFGFSAIQAGNLVKFGETVSNVLAASPTQLTVPVPPTNFAGNVPLKVTVSGITGQFEQLFTIEGPEIFNISPTTSYPDKVLTITGKNFSAIANENTVLFNNYYNANVVSATTTEVKVEIPGGITAWVEASFTTPMDISIKVTEKTATKLAFFTPLSPWTRLKDFPGVARTHATGFSIGQTGYVGTGTFSANCSCYLNDFWAYNSLNDSWTQIAPLAGSKRDFAISFSVNNKGYVGGGSTLNNSYTYDLWEYDPTLNQWTQKNDLPVSSSDYAKTININGEIYLFSGGLFKYDPNLDTWNVMASYPGPGITDRIIAFKLNGKIYVSTNNLEFYEYDPNADLWTRKADIPQVYGSWRFESFSTQNMGFVGGGLNYVDYGKTVAFYRYNPTLDKWEQGPGAITSVFHSASFEINNNVYFVTGGDQTETKNVIKFNPNY